MASDLEELKERVAVCRTEIASLETEIAKFCASSVSTIVERSPDLRSYKIKAIQTKPISTRFKSKAGMIANELRSVLDGLACQLALRNGKTTSNVYFPISKSEEIFKTDGLAKIKKLAPSDQDRIIALNPFCGGHKLLYGLHQADKTRKHQRLVGFVSSAGVNAGGFIVLGPNSAIENCSFDGVPVNLTTSSDLNFIGNVGQPIVIAQGAGVPPQTNAVLNIAYSEPRELEGEPLIKTLVSFADLVDGIVAIF
jgi:hypothetical protein